MITRDEFGCVVLISGSGSNLQALIDAGFASSIRAVISNKANAYGLERAKQAGITTHVLSHKDFSSRETYDTALAELIHPYKPQVIVLAGFMRILTPAFVEQFLGKIINIHPSLLPKYPGLHTHQRALDAGDKQHGVSIHFVTAELDGGPLIAQASLPILADDTAESLQQNVHALEHQLYPKVLSWFKDKRIQLVDSEVFIDGHRIFS